MSNRAKLMLGAVLTAVVAGVVIVASLPKSDGAAAPIPLPPADTALAVPAAPAPAPATADSNPVRTAPASSPAATPGPTPPTPAAGALKPKDAIVRLSGVPAGAEIRVDNRVRVGRSLTMPAGRHIVMVSAAGYVARTDTLQLRAGETISWSPALIADTPRTAVRPPDTHAAPKPSTPAGPTCATSVQAEKWPDAFESCMREALAGNATARRSLAGLYEKGHGTARSDESAARWYESAAQAGDRESMYLIAGWYERGKGVKKDQAAALQWYTRAAEAGHAAAQYTLGEAYEKGRLGAQKDNAKAIEWYGKAAAQGNRDAAGKVQRLSR